MWRNDSYRDYGWPEFNIKAIRAVSPYSRHRWVVGVLSAVFVLCVVWISYNLGQSRGLEIQRSALLDLRMVQEDLLKLNMEATHAWLEIEQLQNNGLSERQFKKILQKNIWALQRQIAEQKDELSFYRSILGSTETQEGLRIERIDLTIENERDVEINLVLSQVNEHQRIIKGSVRVTFHGQQNGQSIALPLPDLAQINDYPMPFKFKYLQEFPAVLKLPAGFKPTKIDVIVNTDKRSGIRTTTRSFDWSLLRG